VLARQRGRVCRWTGRVLVRVFNCRLYRNGSTSMKPCDACAGTGQRSPWEHDFYIWKDRVPFAVCGGCRGSGLLGMFGRPLSQARSAEMCASFHDDPASLVGHLRALAAAASGGDAKQAPGEAPQSGPKGNAQWPASFPQNAKHFSDTKDGSWGPDADGEQVKA
jgi:hypothetical protein